MISKILALLRPVKENCIVTGITKMPVITTVELKNYHIKDEVLLISIPEELRRLITDKKIYQIEDVLRISLDRNVSRGVKAEAVLTSMSSSTHLNCIRFYPANGGWDEQNINYIIKETERIIQENLPESKCKINIELK